VAEDDPGGEFTYDFSAVEGFQNLQASIAVHPVFIGLEEIRADGGGLDEIAAGAVT
jgi:hypothetical protein